MIEPGVRAAWFRGPSRVLVVGVVVCDNGTQRCYSRLEDRSNDEDAPLQRMWKCIEECTLAGPDGLSHPRAQWRVPECDFIELPQDASWRDALRECAKKGPSPADPYVRETLGQW